MITKHSINLAYTDEKCFARRGSSCDVMGKRHDKCGTHKCPFYKPWTKRAWIRVEDREGCNLVPPSEYYG